MKMISKIMPYIFFGVAITALFSFLNIGIFIASPLKMTSQKKIQYDPVLAPTYSEEEARQILKSAGHLKTSDIEYLLSARATQQVPNKQADYCDDCKEAVALIKSERDDRIKAERSNKTKSIWIFCLTVFIGVAIFCLKHKKLGIKIITSQDYRDDIINITEFAFGITIILINTFM